MHIEYLRECLLVSETLNFSRAATLAHSSQPAISKHVREVEHEIGVRLFERTTHGVEMTEAGAVAIAGIRSALELLDRSCEQARELSHGASGSIVLSVPYYFTSDQSDPIVQNMHETVPGCEIHLLSCQPVTALDQMMLGRSDIALTMRLENQPRDLDCMFFSTVSYNVLLKTSSPLSKQATVSVEELCASGLVMLEKKGYYAFRDIVELHKVLDAHGVRVEEVEQIELIPSTMHSLDAFAVVPPGAQNMGRPDLRAVPIADGGFEPELCFYWRRDNDNPMVSEFLYLAEQAKASRGRAR